MVAIITARGGSKRLPRKNLADLAGHPLIYYTIKAARECTSVTGTFVTTEDAEIAEVSKGYGAEIVQRPAELASDQASSEGAVRHALEEIRRRGGAFEAFCLLQPTSPLRTAEHITQAFNTFREAGGRRTVAVAKAPRHVNKLLLWRGDVTEPVFGWPAFGAAAGSFGDVYLPNGALYICGVSDFLESNSLYANDLVPFVMDESLDIDTLEDLRAAERKLLSPTPSTAKN